MDRRQILGAGVGLLGLGSISYALFAPVNDEELIAQVLDELEDALSFSEPVGNPIFFGTSLSEKFETIFTEQVQIRVSEVVGNIPSSRHRLGLAAARTLSRYSSLDVSLSIDSLSVAEDTAKCEATAKVTGNDQGRPRTDSRPVHFAFAKVDGDWLIRSAIVKAPR